MPRSWSTISSRPLGNFRIFSLRADQKISPRTGDPCEFIVIDAVNWVNVVAVTAGQQLVMIEQFRHGSNTFELEVPGGTVEVSDASPIQTGVRELREETGYEGVKPRLLGQIFPNPAIMSNTCYTVLIENCELRHAIQLDSGEDISVRLIPIGEITALVQSGKIRHSLVAVALFHFHLWQQTGPIP